MFLKSGSRYLQARTKPATNAFPFSILKFD